MITLQEIIERDKRPPSVTVSMLCYNHEKYVDEAIRGVLMQKTNFPVNIVIHDDASTDKSAEIIRRYAAENPNITAILQPKNLFQQRKSALPYMLPYYTGKYMAYCECDDFWIDEQKLQIQVDYLEANPDCVAVCSNTIPVNKYSQYDEVLRTGHNIRTGEGDYPARYRGRVKHQTATYVIRNFWQFMTDEEIAFYISIRDFGDEKVLNMCFGLGKVHFFKKELAAYRRVLDEGDSVSARTQKIGKYEFFKRTVRRTSELYVMLEHFFGEKHPYKYIYVLWNELYGRVKYHISITRDAKLNNCYHFRNVPLYIWPVFAGYVLYRAAKKVAKMILPKKVIELVKKLRRNPISVLTMLIH